MKTFAAVVVVLALAAAGCGSGGEENESEQATGTPLKTITISETEFRLQPSTVRIAKPGVYAFHAVNHGTTEHALEIEGEGSETKTSNIEPGKSATLKVELKKASYEMYCPVDGHKDMGMKGSISVAGAMGGGSHTSTDQGDSGYGYG